ncbi:MAG: T9SS type A sorting domain-containing protein [candidate division Zixibacteria bacterium]|nr:T9SS type A sorting domain-containing protein [candidate division Zixibacteria bacterium]
MRLKVLLVLAAVCVVLMATESFAADTCYVATDTCKVCRTTVATPTTPVGTINMLDIGVCDTVRIGCPIERGTIFPGDSIKVPIYLWNDEELKGFSLGFAFDSTELEIVTKKTYDTTGSAIPVDTRSYIVENVLTAGRYLIGWADFSAENPLSVHTTATLLITMNFKVKSTATPMHIVLDSVYVLPGGPFLLTTPIGTKLYPQYVHCPQGDIMLPIQEVQVQLLPERYELGQNMPNPFNPNTVIVFAVPRPAEVRIEVFNVLGQKVKTLANEFSKAGYKRVEWDGTDDNGSSVASGVYLYRMTAGDFSETKKMLLLK